MTLAAGMDSVRAQYASDHSGPSFPTPGLILSLPYDYSVSSLNGTRFQEEQGPLNEYKMKHHLNSIDRE